MEDYKFRGAKLTTDERKARMKTSRNHIPEQDPLKLITSVGALGHLPHPFQWQGQVAFEDLLPEGLRPAKKAVS